MKDSKYRMRERESDEERERDIDPEEDREPEEEERERAEEENRVDESPDSRRECRLIFLKAMLKS